MEKSSKDKKVENEAEEEEFKIKVGEDLEELVLKRDKMDKLFSPQMMNCLNQHDIKYIYIPHLEPSHSYQILHSYLTEQTIDITLLSIGEAIFLGIFSPRIENDAEEFIGLNFEAMKKEIEKDFNEKRSYIHPDIGDKEESNLIYMYIYQVYIYIYRMVNDDKWRGPNYYKGKGFLHHEKFSTTKLYEKYQCK